jgi:hypothetical protein
MGKNYEGESEAKHELRGRSESEERVVLPGAFSL